MAKKETKKVAKKVTKKETKKIEKPKAVKKPAPSKKEPKKVEVKAKKQEPKKKEDKKVVVKAKPVEKKDVKPTNYSQKANSKEDFRKAIEKGEKSGMLGVFSDDINRVLDANISKEEREYNDYHTLVQAKRNGDIVRGVVIGNGYNEERKQLYVLVRFNTITVKIFENQFFEKNFFFGKSYDAKPEDIKRAWRKTALSRYQYANVCFKVIGNEDHIISEGEFKGQREYNVIGDRCLAMDTLKDIYFFHRNRKDNKLPPREVKIGNSYSCNVLDVTYNNIIVECCGVETRISANEISDYNLINCFESGLHVGDVKDFYVKSIDVKDNKVNLGLSGRTMATPNDIIKLKKSDTLVGRVLHYNPKNDVYTIYLEIGVTASVYRNNVQGFSELAVNDKVSVTITEKKDNKYVVGNCVKIR